LAGLKAGLTRRIFPEGFAWSEDQRKFRGECVQTQETKTVKSPQYRD
jgi:hypothetical protein